jgi:transcriptional regulator with XRE-family HTH domain
MNHNEVKRQLLANPETAIAYENPPLRLKIARAVVERRRELGKTQSELAKMLSTSQNQVYRLESGDANVTVKTLEMLRQVLEIEFVVETPSRQSTPEDSSLVAAR